MQRERERLAVGIEMITNALRRGGRVVFVGAGTSGRLGILESAEMPPTFSTDPLLVQAMMAGGREAIFGAKEGVEDNYEEGARAMTRFPSHARRRGDRRVGQRHDAVRARGVDARPQGRHAHHLRDLRPGHRTPDVRGSHDCPGRRRGGDRGLHATQGGHRDETGAQHADHRRHGPDRQDLRQPDGGRAHRIREAQGSRLPDRQHRHRAGLRGVRAPAHAGALEREGRHRDAEDGAVAPEVAGAAPQGARLDARGDRRGHRAAAEGDAAGTRGGRRVRSTQVRRLRRECRNQTRTRARSSQRPCRISAPRARSFARPSHGASFQAPSSKWAPPPNQSGRRHSGR